MIRTLSQALPSILFSALVFASPWALAAGDTTPAPQGKSDKIHCAGNNSNCRASATSSDLAQAFIRHARQDVCPEGAPECAARAKSERAHADHEVRDRHACRD